MQRNKLMNVLERLTLAATALGVGLWAILASLVTALGTGIPIWLLGADGFTEENHEVLLSGEAFAAIYQISRLYTVAFPILVLATPTKYFNRCKWVLLRIVVFVAAVSLDCWVVMTWFRPYVDWDSVLEPMPHAFDEIRASLGPVERVVYGGLLDRAEQGASSWIVVLHAAILTALILIVFEVLRWLVRRFRSSKQEGVSNDEAAASNHEAS